MKDDIMRSKDPGDARKIWLERKVNNFNTTIN